MVMRRNPFNIISVSQKTFKGHLTLPSPPPSLSLLFCFHARTFETRVLRFAQRVKIKRVCRESESEREIMCVCVFLCGCG